MMETEVTRDAGVYQGFNFLHLTCPICSQTSFEVYVGDKDSEITSSTVGSSRTEISPGRILRCLSCRFGFRQSRPTAEQLAQLYRHLDSRVYESEEDGRSRAAIGYLRIVKRYMTATGRILDVGCASGLFLQCAKHENWSVIGVEPSETLARKAREILGADSQIHCTTLQAAGLSPASFDVVTLWDVLEHVPDPISFLRLAGSLLKSGGLLFANVPNLDSMQARVLRSRWPLLLPEHLNYFNSNSLRICGIKAGLHWLESCQRSAAFSLGYVLYRLQQHRIPGSSLAYRLVNSVGVRDFILPVPLGEICGVWKR